MELGLKASAIFCPRALFRFFTESFGDSVNSSCHTNCCPKTAFFIPISAHEKSATSALGFWPITWPLSSSSSASRCHAIPSGYYGDLCISPFLSTNLGLRSSYSLTSIHYFLQQTGRSWPTSLFPPFNGQSLRPVNSNTEGVGGISYFSPLSGRPRDISYKPRRLLPQVFLERGI